MRIEILDSMLRDGAQGENISYSVQDKLNIVKNLDEFGVPYIEAGNPGSNPKDMEFFEKVRSLQLKNSKLVAFGSTRRKDLPAEQDPNVRSLLEAGTAAVSVFGKAWDLHVREILRVSQEENLELIRDTVEYLTAQGREVIFDAEHFFDGYKANPGYALSVLDTALAAGAAVLCLCDTNGGALPLEVYQITKTVCERYNDARIGIHCHHDTGCAVASSMLAVEAGAVHVQGTFIGIGERCGNADLGIIIPNLQLKQGLACVEGDLTSLSETVIKLSEIANCTMPGNRPYVGSSAFAHKGGMHIDGVSKLSRSFEHIDPEYVGNNRRFLASEVSGRTTVASLLAKIAPELPRSAPETTEILKCLKEHEHMGYQFEAADASLELLILKTLGRYKPNFKLKMYKTTGEYPAPNGEMSASAMLQVEAFGRTEMNAAVGNGPVHALDTALRKALGVFYPELSRVHLVDYKVRVLSGADATAAKVRVLIDSSDGSAVWSTVGVSTDIIEASWIALVDSIEYFLTHHANGQTAEVPSRKEESTCQ